jgi:hypothetical protein
MRRRRTTTPRSLRAFRRRLPTSWTQGGFYRAIVVMTGTEQTFGARVFLQWLALSEANPVPMVVATVPIKEIND